MQASRHILLYTDDPGIYGVAQYNHALACGLHAAGHRVTIAQAERSHALMTERCSKGIEHVWLTSDDFSLSLTNPADGQRILSQTRPDIILFSNCCPLSNFAAKRTAGELSIPYVAIDHFVAPYLAERFAQVLPELSSHYSRAVELVSVSQENLSLLRKFFRLPANRGRVIHLGRPAEFFQPPSADTRIRLRAEVNISEDAVIAFTAARMEAVKGFQYQLQAIGSLRQQLAWNNLYFVWAGAGSILDTMRAEVAKNNLGDHVKVLGERSDIRDWLDASDIFLLPSEAEGMPFAVMEAMAKGLPVAATAVSGIPEELGDTGKLLSPPVPDPSALISELSDTIRTWATDPVLRRRVGDACRARAQSLFREQRMVDETRELLERAVSTPTPGAAMPSTSNAAITFAAGDYVSPNFQRISLDFAFPNISIRDRNTATWPYLRKEIPHNWYVDRRSPHIGFLSRDEAHILYNTALRWKGRRALEIGCWLGWSAAHFASGGVELDIVDPLLDKTDIVDSVKTSLKAAGVIEHTHFHPGFSPAKVTEIAERDGRRWGLIFIDGNHDAPGPRDDAVAVERLAEPDALVLFHDLSSPEVGQGLDYFRSQGWNTMVYQTMQIMGVAWRGSAEPVAHIPDPTVAWTLPAHLHGYPISGLTAEGSASAAGALREARQHLTEELLAINATDLATAFAGDLGRRYRDLAAAGLRDLSPARSDR